MKKKIIKIYRWGGGNSEKWFDYIAIKFMDGTTKSIPDNHVDGLKKQVNDLLKKMKK